MGASHACNTYSVPSSPAPLLHDIALRAAFLRGVRAGLERAVSKVAYWESRNISHKCFLDHEAAERLYADIRAIDPATVEDK